MKMPTVAAVLGFAILAPLQLAHSGPKVVDADDAMVAHCTFVADVNGRSVFGERLKGPAVEKAKEDARSQAAKAGATHVVWGKISSTDITTAEGKAYHCGS